MGQQSRREYTYRVVEHIVPRGADMADLAKAMDAAAREYHDLHNILVPFGESPLQNLPDDWARMEADDDFVIIRITEGARDAA